MTATAAASRPRRRGPTAKQAQQPLTWYDANGNVIRHRKLTDSEARNFAEALPEDTDPDDVSHPQVRQALIDRFVELERQAEEEAYNNSLKGRASNAAGKVRGAASSVGKRQVTTIAGHSVSLASVPLGILAYAALINLINGTFRQWLSAKFTNGGGNLP